MYVAARVIASMKRSMKQESVEKTTIVIFCGHTCIKEPLIVGGIQEHPKLTPHSERASPFL